MASSNGALNLEREEGVIFISCSFVIGSLGNAEVNFSSGGLSTPLPTSKSAIFIEGPRFNQIQDDTYIPAKSLNRACYSLHLVNKRRHGFC